MIKKIDHVVIFVTEMDQAIDFYCKILGFEIAYKSPEYTSLKVPGETSIGLHIADQVSGQEAGGATTQISFGVGDIKNSLNELQEKDVNITREIQEIAPGRFMFNFVDPFGNQLSCFENKDDQ